MSTNRVIIGRDSSLLFEDTRGVELTRLDSGEIENLVQRVNLHNDQRSPQDIFDELTEIEFTFIKQKKAIVDELFEDLDDNYGKLYIVRSYPHKRIFRGFIPSYGSSNVLENDNQMNFIFLMFAKDNYDLV